ncbi:MAG: septum formation initiator family protein [Kurthia sp.]|nr:septum formation initiator family protein [Candidatus Kurthia equi]
MSEQKQRNSISRIHQDFVKQEALREKRQHNRKVTMYRRIAIMTTVFILLVGSLVFSIVEKHSSLQQKQAEKIVLQKELKIEKEKKEELKTQLVKLDDDDYIAKIVRKDLFMSKKGEKIFNIPNPSEDNKQSKVSKDQKE